MRGVVAAMSLAQPGLDCVVRNESALWSQLAVQGPTAVDVVSSLCGEHVRDIGGYCFTTGKVGGDDGGIIARTGYTGEDGFELYVHNEHAAALWDAVVAAGAVPCGLAARDTLRLEAGMCLYGNDIDDDTTPLQANLGWIVKLEGRPSFIGQSILVAEKTAGPARVLRGLEMLERGIARHGYEVVDDAGMKVGVVTSGTQAPFVNKAIAFAFLDRAAATPGHTVAVSIRGKPVKATVVKLPFYKRSR
jgi:aminomethyltransferase